MSEKSAGGRGKKLKPAIVLAAFGTTDVDALASIINIKNRVRAAFPDHEVRLAFTSGIIRGVWRKRAGDEEFRAKTPGAPAEVYSITNPLSALAALAEEGFAPISVQSLHIADGAEFRDLKAMVTALAGIETVKPSSRPFVGLALGEPALGDGGEDYLRRAAEALTPLVRRAEEAGAALVLMGHGNEHLKQDVYGRLEALLRKAYPSVSIGLVEGGPGLDYVAEALDNMADRPETVLLAPLMVVAGDHAKNDLAGESDDSWASRLEASGYRIQIHLEGLGSLDAWADIYVEHLNRLRSVRPESGDCPAT